MMIIKPSACYEFLVDNAMYMYQLKYWYLADRRWPFSIKTYRHIGSVGKSGISASLPIIIMTSLQRLDKLEDVASHEKMSKKHYLHYTDKIFFLQ